VPVGADAEGPVEQVLVGDGLGQEGEEEPLHRVRPVRRAQGLVPDVAYGGAGVRLRRRREEAGVSDGRHLRRHVHGHLAMPAERADHTDQKKINVGIKAPHQQLITYITDEPFDFTRASRVFFSRVMSSLVGRLNRTDLIYFQANKHTITIGFLLVRHHKKDCERTDGWQQSSTS
jgi:hypothetical protein